MRRILILLVLVLVVGGAGVTIYWIGWGADEAKAVLVPLDQVPEAFLKTAKEKLPEVTFDHARKLPNGNYEIRGKAKGGKVREVEVNSTGKVVEVE